MLPDHFLAQVRNSGISVRVNPVYADALLAATSAFHAERRACGAEGCTLDQSVPRYRSDVLHQRLLIDEKLYGLATLTLRAGVDGVGHDCRL